MPVSCVVYFELIKARLSILKTGKNTMSSKLKKLLLYSLSAFFALFVLLSLAGDEVQEDQNLNQNLSHDSWVENKASVVTADLATATATDSLVVDHRADEQPKIEENEVASRTDTISNTSAKQQKNPTITITSVVDGDTVKGALDGSLETFRLIGIDTPETVHPNKPVECFGVEASKKAKQLLQDKVVSINTDKTQDLQDKYGRRLVYITLPDGRDFGEVMIGSGYAYEYTYNLPYENKIKYKEAEKLAREGKIGLWSDQACAGFTQPIILDTSKKDYDKKTDVNTKAEDSEGDAECLIKGNISTKTGEKIYHVPGQRYYNQTVISEEKGERWFCTEGEAREAGWRKAKL